VPKRVNVVPNLRVDIPDFLQESSGLSVGGQQHFVERLILANFAAIMDGFRVEIANQGTSPRMLTVYNGVAFDRSGTIVNNEDDFNASRTITLPGNGTFYVEVKFVTNESDTDARGFWDPTFSNGNDPSGDLRPKGREFSENIATRLTPDWQIVSPVSTTGFEITTTPNSLKIPVAQLTVSGNVITGASTTAWRSVLRALLDTSGTKAKLFSTRGMPDAFTLSLDPGGANAETLTVTANDRENGILTVSSSPVANHPAGERAAVGGGSPAQFVVPSSGADKRALFFQADSDAGHYINLDPQTNPATDGDRARKDTEIDSLRNYVNFLAAQLREMKWGTFTTASLGLVGPPYQNFDTKTKYFDSAGGLLAARTNTVSIGDGVNSWGDFNISQIVSSGSGTDLNAALTFAVAQLNLTGSGGIIFLKRGIYDITTKVTSAFDVTIVGEGQGTTLVRLNGSDPMLDMGTGTVLRLQNLTISLNSGSTNASANFGSSAQFIARDVTMTGISGTITGGYVQNCTFRQSAQVIAATLANITFDNCHISCNAANNTGRAINIGSCANTIFRQCRFDEVGAAQDWLIDVGTLGAEFDECTFTAPTNKGVVRVNVVCNKSTFRDCTFSSTGIGLNLTNAALVTVENCVFTVNENDQVAIQFAGSCANCVVQGNQIVQSATDLAHTTIGLFMASPKNCWVRDNDFLNCDICVRIVGCDGLWIRGNEFRNTPSAERGRLGVEFLGTSGTTDDIHRGVVSDNVFTLFGGDVAYVAGITITNFSGKAGVDQLTIRGNMFSHMGGTTSNRVLTIGVDLQNVEPSTPGSNVVLTGNEFIDISSQSSNYALRVSSCTNVIIANNSISLDDAGMSGMLLQVLDEFSITGNTIHSDLGLSGILITDSVRGAISGNSIRVEDLGAVGIRAGDANNNDLSITGNTIFFGHTGGVHAGAGIQIPTSLATKAIMVAGNTAVGTAPDGAGTDHAIAKADGSLATDGTRALTTVEAVGPGTYTDPADLTDVGLNWRSR
jgi:hypothetical protein